MELHEKTHFSQKYLASGAPGAIFIITDKKKDFRIIFLFETLYQARLK